MAGILDLIQSDFGKQIISNISNQTGISTTEATNVVSSSVPELLGAMQGNMLSSNNASGLLGALTNGKHDGSILDNLGSFLNGADFSDGNKILNHLLGDKLSAVESGISSKTGLSPSIIAKILPMLAPIIMGYIGKQTQDKNVTNTSDLGGLLGGLLTDMTSGNNAGGDILSSVLDQNGDGKLDVNDAISAVTDKKGGLGGLLGGIFGK
jgi:hypothetical protein